VTFVNGDQFGARARANGTVEVYRNGVLLGTRDVTGWPYYANGGYLGLWFIYAEDAVLDDFGGWTSASAALPGNCRRCRSQISCSTASCLWRLRPLVA
jgi:hypothetical protein